MTGNDVKLAKLLQANRIAVVGASSNPQKITGRPIAYMLKQGFQGEIIPINPRHQHIQGLRAFSSLTAVDGPVDLALIGTAAAEVEASIQEGIASGVAAFVVLSSGFSEHNAHGAELQARLSHLAKIHNIAIVGPNCLGVINAQTGLIASFTTAMEENTLRAGGFGFASQSGALAAYWLDLVLQAGLGVSRWVTTGNECDIDLAASITMLAKDPMTSVIGVYSEGVQDGPAFREALLCAAQVGKPVFIIKAGRSAAGATAAASHTGALAGEDHVFQACFDQTGAVRVDSITELIDAAKLILHDAIPTTGRVGIMSVSGGAGVMLADAIERTQLSLPAFGPDTQKALSTVLPSFSKPQNPVDLTAGVLANTELFSQTLTIMGIAPELEVCVLFIGLMQSITDVLTATLLKARQRSNRPFILIWIGAQTDTIATLNAAGIPVYPDIPPAIKALDLVFRAYRIQTEAARRPKERLVVKAPVSGVLQTLTEWKSKQILDHFGGVELPRSALIQNPSDVPNALSQLPSGPWVVKLQSSAMPHKSEFGAVRLGLTDPNEVSAAVQEMQQACKDRQIGYEGFLIEEMIPFDLELIAGLRRDPVFGPLMVVGRGGVEAELDPDICMALAPLSSDEITAMLGRLRCAPLLNGFRGRPHIPVDRISLALEALHDAFLAAPQLQEIEINPLVSQAGRVWALDALIKVIEA